LQIISRREIIGFQDDGIFGIYDMKRLMLFAAALCVAQVLGAAEASPKETVAAAIQKLAAQTNYTWHADMSSVEGTNQVVTKLGHTEGKTVKQGYTELAMTRGNSTLTAFLRDGNGVIQTPDGWKSLADAAKDDGEGTNRFRLAALMLRDYQLPAAQALALVDKCSEVTLSNGVYTAALSAASAGQLLSFRRAASGSGAPDIREAKGTVRFWLKEGCLSKLEFHLQGTFAFSNTARRIDRTTEVEIKDVGTTTITVPEEVKKNLP
jgi:hypothetical protein